RVTRKTDLAAVNFQPDTVIRKRPVEKKREHGKDVKIKPVSFSKDSVLNTNSVPNRWRKD
uniref:hypothetical protein n=1 Tax=Longitalea luteola TaxID=2812563 RepID=UPI001A9578BC